MTKECPILFSAPMVRAILNGRKTQTRRIVKLPKERGSWEPSSTGGVGVTYSDGTPCPEMSCIWNTSTGTSLICQHGLVGDRLWVRETFKQYNGIISYKADGNWISDFNDIDNFNPHENIKWKRSIHMPRSASRILLEITGVRVERLQDISECDAKAEGSYVCDYFGRRLLDQSSNQGCYKWGYRSIWESLNGTGSWDLNPFVWVIEFKLLEVRK